MRSILPNGRVALLFALWLGLGAAGYFHFCRYELTAGQSLPAPEVMPPGLPGAMGNSDFYLLTALHPRCPCSRATVNELARAVADSSVSVSVTVLMFKPDNEPDAWIQGPLLNRCRRMGFKVVPDPAGRLAKSLGQLTSGGVLLYDHDGRLQYHGGITPARGQEGASVGRSAVVGALHGCTATKSGPVFGCPIFEASQTSQE
jgi:hypothetical protein